MNAVIHFHIKKLIKSAGAIALLTLLIITQTGCGSKTDEPVSRTEYYLNTTCQISVYGMDSSEAEKLLDEAYDTVSKYENLLSKTVKGSDVYRINHAKGEAVTVSDDTLQVLEMALTMGELSGGAFDCTVGALVDLWNFTGEKPKVPDDADVDKAVGSVDYRNVEISGNQVSLADPAAAIDLGGIAKGYIADRTAEILEKGGASSAIVNLGGNVVTIGSKPDGSPFVVGIERPYSDRTEMVGSVKAADRTLVTSGIYERNFKENGKLYHHVLDPKTGYPAETDLEAVTIAADKGYSGFCDGLSTSCLIMGEDRAKKFIADIQAKYPDMHIEASFINSDDKLSVTDGMDVELAEE